MCGVLPMVCRTSLASIAPPCSRVPSPGRGDDYVLGLFRAACPPVPLRQCAMPAPLQNDTFLRACLSQPVPFTPVWLMRQAGRYLPEYKATRARAGSFMGLATNPELATEVTLQPLDRYRARRRHPLQRHPHRARRDGPGPGLRGRRGPALRPAGARRGRRREARRARHGQAALRLRCRRLGPQGAGRPRAADRVFRQPLDARLLHGRRRRLGRLSPRQDHALRAARPAASHAGDQCRGGRALSQRPDRCRRAGRDDLRQLGRRPRRRRLPGVQPRLYRRACCAGSSATPTAAACRTSSSPRAAGRGSKRSASSAPMSSASTGRSISARRAQRVGDRRRPAGQPRPERAVRRPGRPCAARSRRRSRASIRRRRRRATDTSSTSVTASASTRRRKRSATLVDAVHELSRPYHAAAQA